MDEEENHIDKSKMYLDAAIDNAELFNFKAYSDAILEIILNKENKTPFSIAINGKWGRGKTTLMKTIRKKLKSKSGTGNNRKVKSVWFDAWKYSETDSMLAALVFEIFDEMASEKGIDKLKAKIVGGKKINILKAFSDIVATVTMSRVEFDKWLKDQAYKQKLSFYDLFKDYMKNILTTFVLEDGEYSDKEGVLVIFIDDLDRCSPNQITQVLESINLFFDQEGCFFLFGVDVALISNAIRSHYENIEGFSGIDYIKKMFQLQFDLPEIEEKGIKKFMEEELNIEETLKEYFELIIEGLESNQREIKRFLNSLNLMRMVGESIKIEKFEYKEELLIKWNILNFSSADFINQVKEHPELMIKMQGISMKKTDEAESYIKNLDDPYKRLCKKFREEKILNILKKGEAKFKDSKDVRTYMYLSSVAPKEPEISHEELIELLRLGNVSKFNALRDRKGIKDLDLSGVDLTRHGLGRNNLSGVNFHNTKLIGTDLRRVDLIGADLGMAVLNKALMSGANLKMADLSGTHLIGAHLIAATLCEAVLIGVDLSMADLRGANLSQGIILVKEPNYNETNVKGADFSGAIIGDYKFLEYLRKHGAKNVPDEITKEEIRSLLKKEEIFKYYDDYAIEEFLEE